MNVTKQKTSSRKVGTKRTPRNPVHLLAAHAVDAALDKKARDVTVMDMRGVSSVAECFVVCTGESDIQIKAIAEAVKERIRETCAERPWHTEGYGNLQWVLLDYVDLVVHVFSEEKRSFYSLERLWGDAPVEQVPDEGSAADVQLLQEMRSEQEGA